MESLQRVANQLNKSQNINNNTEDVFSHLKLPRSSTNLTRKTESLDAPSFHFDAYRDENEKPFVFRSVIKAQQEIVDQKMDKEYSSMEGIATFNTAIQEALFGKHHPLVRDKKIVTFQTLSGQGALRVGLAFLQEHTPGLVYVSDPAGEEHAGILNIVGLQSSQYPYLNPVTRELDFDGMCKALASAKAGSIVLLHASAHSPTGVDPTFEQWRILAKLMKTKGLLPFFESASQGLASGDLETDVKSIQIFLEEGLQLLVAQSFDKTMGLYGERMGALHIVCRSATTAEILSSQLNLTIRCMYGMPPINGARIIDKVLRNPQYTAEWKEDLRSVYERVQQMKALLYEELVKENVQGDWTQIKKQSGMYWNMGLTARQNEELVYKHNIYFVKDGRMNMSCINHKNVKFVVQAIKDITKSTKEEITVLLPSRV